MLFLFVGMILFSFIFSSVFKDCSLIIFFEKSSLLLIILFDDCDSFSIFIGLFKLYILGGINLFYCLYFESIKLEWFIVPIWLWIICWFKEKAVKAGCEILIETLSTEISLGIKDFVDITHSFCASELISSCAMSTSFSILFSFVLFSFS